MDVCVVGCRQGFPCCHGFPCAWNALKLASKWLNNVQGIACWELKIRAFVCERGGHNKQAHDLVWLLICLGWKVRPSQVAQRKCASCPQLLCGTTLPFRMMGLKRAVERTSMWSTTCTFLGISQQGKWFRRSCNGNPNKEFDMQSYPRSSWSRCFENTTALSAQLSTSRV